MGFYPIFIRGCFCGFFEKLNFPVSSIPAIYKFPQEPVYICKNGCIYPGKYLEKDCFNTDIGLTVKEKLFGPTAFFQFSRTNALYTKPASPNRFLLQLQS